MLHSACAYTYILARYDTAGYRSPNHQSSSQICHMCSTIIQLMLSKVTKCLGGFKERCREAVHGCLLTCLSVGVIFRVAWLFVISFTAPSCRSKQYKQYKKVQVLVQVLVQQQRVSHSTGQSELFLSVAVNVYAHTTGSAPAATLQRPAVYCTSCSNTVAELQQVMPC